MPIISMLLYFETYAKFAEFGENCAKNLANCRSFSAVLSPTFKGNIAFGNIYMISTKNVTY